LPGEGGAADDSNVVVVEITSASYLTVAGRGPSEPVCRVAVPRRDGELQDELPPAAWAIETSLFAPYDEVAARRSFCDKCFEVDWKHAGVVYLLRDEGDRWQVRDIFRGCYGEIMILHASLRSIDRGPASEAAENEPSPLLAFGMGVHEYTHMLAQHNLIGEDLSLIDADVQFVLAAIPPKEEYSKWNVTAQRGGRVVQRHGFLQLLVRLALCKFAPSLLAHPTPKDARKRGKAKTVAHALEILISRHIMHPYPPMKNNARCAEWRREVLHQKVVEAVYRKHMKFVIDPLFSAYSGGKRFLFLESWLKLLDDLGAFPCTDDSLSDSQLRMNTWDRAWIWQMSAMLRVDELTGKAHVKLYFVEFLEALGRLTVLQAARAKLVKAMVEKSDRFDYGMEIPCPASVFCIDRGVVTDSDVFAAMLHDFFTSEDVCRVVLQIAECSRESGSGAG